jgi:hypothetical protein
LDKATRSTRSGKPSNNGRHTPKQPVRPAVEAVPELIRPIHPGTGGNVGVTAEEVNDFDNEGYGDEHEPPGKIKLQKPAPREFNVIDPARVIPVRFLIHKPGGKDSVKEEYFFVTQDIRKDILDELKAVRVYLYYSVDAREFRIWPVKVTPGNSYYDSLQAKLFNQKPEAILGFEWLIRANTAQSTYHVRRRQPVADRKSIVWPETPLTDLVTEAIGHDHIISSKEHPLYLALLQGEEVK